MSAGTDLWIRWITIGCVTLLALIAGTVSYLCMHMLVARHVQPGVSLRSRRCQWTGWVLAASTTLLADSRSGADGPVPRPRILAKLRYDTVRRGIAFPRQLRT